MTADNQLEQSLSHGSDTQRPRTYVISTDPANKEGEFVPYHKPPVLSGQYHSLTVYTFHCGRCTKTLDGEFGPIWLSGEHLVEDYDDLDDRDWQKVGHEWVCPDCWHWCEKATDGSEKGRGPQEGCCNGL